MAVFTALSSAPPLRYVNVTRWHDHISALLRTSGVIAEGEGVKIEPSACSVASTPEIAGQKAAVADEDDDDVDLFGEET
uniref:Elongation factor 1-delta 1 n=1 Tax=Arundo donax TaxID=35708 RepID=A0A0A9EU38_ARUDO